MKTILKTALPAVVLALLMSVPVFAQDGTVATAPKDKTNPIPVFTLETLQTKLNLDADQLLQLKQTFQELNERAAQEQEALQNDPEEAARMAADRNNERLDRIREVLRPEQMEMFDKMIAEQKGGEVKKEMKTTNADGAE